MLDHITEPVLNTPYEPTARHWKLGADNRAIAEVRQGRRPSIGMLPVPSARRELQAQQELQLDPDNLNATVNEIRALVARWRADNYRGATSSSQRLLRHWRDERHEPRLFFAQVEALETLIWLTEVARVDTAQRRAVEDASREHNDGIVRYATKMATGTGKTAVMGMVIAWHAVNAAAGARRRDSRYCTSFVAITPGHTVRERLAVLDPSHPSNVYDEMGLVPAGLRAALGRVRLQVVNFQSFQRRDRLRDATGDGRRLLRRGDSKPDPESLDAMLRRVLRGLPERDAICVLNDEAHHCYLPEKGRRSGAQGDEDDKVAALWFNAIRALRDQRRLSFAAHDFSATPMFIDTTARQQSVMFPWVVSDFPLMDAIEAGLVKIPRVPVDDDTTDNEVTWRHLYKNTQPKTIRPDSPPPTLDSALNALYHHYEDTFERWNSNGLSTPPVFIVVANNIANAEALYRHISGWSVTLDDGSKVHHPGACELFSNIGSDGAGPTDHLRTLLVHSKLEGDDNLSTSSRLGKAFRSQAQRLRTAAPTAGVEGGRSSSLIGDGRELIREALNTVGRPGELGEQIRCVVSVSMLTEGWDTRTVTHVLGFRAFSTQLLCEQVTGRALRRSNYDSFDENGRLTPEFAEVLGVPFDFMPVGGAADPVPPKPRYEVFSIPGRRDRRLDWPALTGYLVEPTGPGVQLDPDRVRPYRVAADEATMAETAGVVGESEVIGIEVDRHAREQSAVVSLAARVATRLEETLIAGTSHDDDGDGDPPYPPRRRRLFLDAVSAVRAWLSHPDVSCDEATRLLRPDLRDAAAHQVSIACIGGQAADGTIVGCFDTPPVRTTADVRFETSLTDRYPRSGGDSTWLSELNVAACHSDFERQVAASLDRRPEVNTWVRNFRLDWTAPYELAGVWHHCVPDFVVRLFGPRHGDEAVHLIVECKGMPDEASRAKADHVRDWWIPAVANSPETPSWLRRWMFAELTDAANIPADLDRAVEDARVLRRLQEPAGAAK